MKRDGGAGPRFLRRCTWFRRRSIAQRSFPWQHAGPGLQWIDAITTAIYSLTPFFIFFIVGFGLARRRQMRLWPIAIAAFLYGAYNITFNTAGQARRFTGWTLSDRMRTWGIHVGGYTFSALFLLDLLLFIVLLFTVARQQYMERRRQSQIELEVKSAREVQHVLMPEETPAIPGYSIASVYKPAAEVGGDFFQVMPQANGGALIVVGDVSGKGLKAAMTVSLIVGTLRTLADYTQRPAEILRGLNRRLIGTRSMAALSPAWCFTSQRTARRLWPTRDIWRLSATGRSCR